MYLVVTKKKNLADIGRFFLPPFFQVDSPVCESFRINKLNNIYLYLNTKYNIKSCLKWYFKNQKGEH